MGLPALTPLELPGFDLHEGTERLISSYATTTPSDLLVDARQHLNALQKAMGGVLLQQPRRRLLVLEVERSLLAPGPDRRGARASRSGAVDPTSNIRRPAAAQADIALAYAVAVQPEPKCGGGP